MIRLNALYRWKRYSTSGCPITETKAVFDTLSSLRITGEWTYVTIRPIQPVWKLSSKIEGVLTFTTSYWRFPNLTSWKGQEIQFAALQSFTAHQLIWKILYHWVSSQVERKTIHCLLSNKIPWPQPTRRWKRYIFPYSWRRIPHKPSEPICWRIHTKLLSVTVRTQYKWISQQFTDGICKLALAQNILPRQASSCRCPM